MNALEKILENIPYLSADDIIQTLGAEMYKGEDKDFPELDKLGNYPNFIQDAIYIIAFDTELAVNGIGGVLDNMIDSIILKIIKAFQNIGANQEADILSKINVINQTSPFSNEIGTLRKSFYLYTDFDIWSLLEIYVEQEKNKYIANIQLNHL